MPAPFISVLIDTYNHEAFIEQAIRSVLDQDFPAARREIIVVDDGSTDRTPDIVRQFEPQVRLIRKSNGGQASAFNAGISECRGEIISFLDGDDWWTPDKLRRVVAELEKNPSLGSIGHGLFEAHSDGRPLGVVVPNQDTLLYLQDPQTARRFTYFRAFLGTSRFTIRKKLLDRIFPIPEELVIEADEYMFTLAPALAPALVLNQPLFHYRLHPGNLYQYSNQDKIKARRKLSVLEALLLRLPPPLREFAVPEDIIAAVLEPIQIDSCRLRLSLDGGFPWETFRIEKAAYAYSYSKRPLGHRLFSSLILAATLALPPRLFYKLRQWYSEKKLHRLRGFIGIPTSAAPVIEHRPVS